MSRLHAILRTLTTRRTPHAAPAPAVAAPDTPEQRLDECQPRVNTGRLAADLMALAAELEPAGYAVLQIVHFGPRVDLCGLAELDTAIPLLATALLRLIERRERLADEVVLRMAMAGELAWVGEAREP